MIISAWILYSCTIHLNLNTKLAHPSLSPFPCTAFPFWPNELAASGANEGETGRVEASAPIDAPEEEEEEEKVQGRRRHYWPTFCRRGGKRQQLRRGNRGNLVRNWVKSRASAAQKAASVLSGCGKSAQLEHFRLTTNTVTWLELRSNFFATMLCKLLWFAGGGRVVDRITTKPLSKECHW